MKVVALRYFNAAGAGQDNGIGFWSVDEAQRIAFYAGGFKGIVWKYAGNVYVNGSNNAFSSNTFTSGDIISVAMDMDNSTATFYKNGSVTQSSIGICCDTCYYAELESDDFIGE